jgi:hypothetical protein
MLCCLKGPNWTAPNQIALNQTMQSQTKTCIAKCKQKTQQCITKADTSFFSFGGGGGCVHHLIS